MKNRNLILSFFGLLALAFSVAPIERAYAQKSTPKIVRWEYTVVGGQSDAKELNELGSRGWELVGADHNNWMWLKRPKQ